MGAAADPNRPKVMRVSTRCRTVDELVAAFATLVDEVSMVVLTDAQRAIGARQPFVVELSDGTFVMKGEAEVMESTPPPRGRLRLRFLALDAAGREVHERMLERKRSTSNGGPERPARLPTEPGMKPLVRIPEPPKRETQTTGAVPVTAKGKIDSLIMKAPAPPAPFARPVPSGALPRNNAPAAAPMAMTPPPRSAIGTAPPSGVQTPPSGAAVPKVVPRVTAKTQLGIIPIAQPPEPAPSKPAPPTKSSTVPLQAPVSVVAPVPGPPVPVADPVPVAVPDPVPVAVDPEPEPDIEPITKVAAPISEETFSDPTRVDPLAGTPLEGRTPGSPYILPANPFGDVAPESLEAFVECTVYEDTGSFSLEDGVKFDADSEAEGEVDDPADPAIDPPAPGPTVAQSLAMLGSPAPAARAGPIVSVALAPPPTPAEPPPGAFPLAAPSPTGRLPQSDLAAPTVATPDATFHAKPLPWLWIGLAGAAVVVLLIGIVVSQLGGGSKASAGSGSGSPSAGKLPTVTPPAVTPDAGAPAVTDSADAAVADVAVPGKPDIPVVSGTGDCEITITSTPDEATVLIEGRNVGKTPLTTAIECGSSKIVVDRNRYERYEKKVRLRAGSPETLAVRLQRPAHSLRITSKPPGATVKVGRHSAGKTPVSVKVNGFETIKITATLKGYETWSSSLYIKPDTTSVNANLKRIPKKKTR